MPLCLWRSDPGEPKGSRGGGDNNALTLAGADPSESIEQAAFADIRAPHNDDPGSHLRRRGVPERSREVLSSGLDRVLRPADTATKVGDERSSSYIEVENHRRVSLRAARATSTMPTPRTMHPRQYRAHISVQSGINKEDLFAMPSESLPYWL